MMTWSDRLQELLVNSDLSPHDLRTALDAVRMVHDEQEIHVSPPKSVGGIKND